MTDTKNLTSNNSKIISLISDDTLIESNQNLGEINFKSVLENKRTDNLNNTSSSIVVKSTEHYKNTVIGSSWYYIQSSKTWNTKIQHNLRVNDSIIFTIIGGGATGYKLNQEYYVISVESKNSIQLSDSIGGTVIDGVASTDTTIDSNLVGWWKMNGDSDDSSGNNNDGTLGDGSTSSTYPTLTTDRFGNSNCAYTFDGSNDYIIINSLNTGSGGLDITNSMTLSCWVKSNTSTWNSNGSIISKRNSFLFYGDVTTKELRFYIHDSTFYEARYTLTDIQNWNLFIGTYDGSTLKLYVNGVLVSIHSHTGSIDNDAGGDLTIGRDDGQSAYFNGSISDVRIYNTALTAAQVKTIYNTSYWTAIKNDIPTSIVLKTNHNKTMNDNLIINKNNNLQITGDIKTIEPILSDKVKEGLVGWWKLDGNTGDSTGYSTSATANNTTLGYDRQGNYNKSYKFNGTTSYISIADSSNLSITSNLTISLWFKRTDDITSSSGIQSLISKSYYDEYDISFSNNDFAFFHGNNNSSNYGRYDFTTDANSLFRKNTWYHIIVTRSGSGTNWIVKLYVNGKIYSEPTATVTGTNTPADSNNNIFIGSRNNGSNSVKASSYFKGEIADVRIYKKVITELDISNLYNEGGNLVVSNVITQKESVLPVLHYKLDETSGVALDSSGGGHNGTVSGATQTATGHDGKVNGAYSFDGSDWITNNTIVNSSMSTSYFGKTAWTISFWVYSEEASTSGTDRYVIDAGYYTGIFSWSYSGTDWDQCWGVYNGSWAKAKYTTALNAKTWYHITATYDNNYLKAYLNGNLEISVQKTGPLSNPYTDLWIGRSHSSQRFLGKIDDFRIYDKALTAEQVKKIYLDSCSLGIGVKEYGRVEIEGSLLVKKTLTNDSTLRPVMIFPNKIEQVSSTGNNWISVENVISGIIIKMVGAGGGGGGSGSTASYGDKGGGGGSGSYAEVYITKDELDNYGATHIYFSIGTGGNGGSGSGNGSNGNSSLCKISNSSSDTSGSTIFTINPGYGGKDGNSYSGPGDGGTKGTISIGSGYCLKGNPGEIGEDSGGSYQHNAGTMGGYSPLGSCGIGPTGSSSGFINRNNGLSVYVHGTNGAGGGGATVRSGGYGSTGSTGGNAFALVYIC